MQKAQLLFGILLVAMYIQEHTKAEMNFPWSTSGKTKVNFTGLDVTKFQQLLEHICSSKTLKTLTWVGGNSTGFPNLSCVGKILQYLNLDENEISTIYSPFLDNLQSLETLMLNSNPISDIPNVDGPSETLTTLELCNCQFKVFPNLTVIGKNLMTLKLCENQISEVNPLHLQGMDKIIHLDLSGNELTQFPELEQVASTLQYLNLENNQIAFFSGEMVKGMMQLKHVILVGNTFTNLPLLSALPSNLEILELDIGNTLVQDDYISLMTWRGFSQDLKVKLVLSTAHGQELPNFCISSAVLKPHIAVKGSGGSVLCDMSIWWLKAAELYGYWSNYDASLTCSHKQNKEMLVKALNLQNLQKTAYVDHTENRRVVSFERMTEETYCDFPPVIHRAEVRSPLECIVICLKFVTCFHLNYGYHVTLGKALCDVMGFEKTPIKDLPPEGFVWSYYTSVGNNRNAQ